MEWVSKVLESADNALYGKSDKLELALITLLAGGNLLIEDTPGVGKTTFAKFLAHSLGLNLTRIQFTNDLLPNDILGSNIFTAETKDFTFKAGPIFGELILADELNRGNSKTQSALLQAMEEKKVSIDGNTYELAREHVLIATQNPQSQIGTFPLPESQLDRFLMKIPLGPPEIQEEKKLLLEQKGKNQNFSTNTFKISKKQLLESQDIVLSSKASPAIAEYIVSLLDYSRKVSTFSSLSTRSGIDLINACKAYKYVRNKSTLVPEDVQYLFPYVMGHRLSSSHVVQEHNRALEFLSKVDVF